MGSITSWMNPFQCSPGAEVAGWSNRRSACRSQARRRWPDSSTATGEQVIGTRLEVPPFLRRGRLEKPHDPAHALGHVRQRLIVLQREAGQILEQLEHDLSGLAGVGEGRFEFQPGPL